MNGVRVSLIALMCLVVVLFVAVGCRSATATPLPSGIRDGDYAIAHYKLRFQGDRFTMLTEYDQEVAVGSFVVSGDRVTFTEVKSPVECKSQDPVYSYQWSFNGKALTFSNANDKCLSRIMLMTENPWVLKG